MTIPTGLSSKETLQNHAFEPAPTTPTPPLGPHLGTAGMPQSLFESQELNKVTGLEGAGFRGGASPSLVPSRESLDDDGLHVVEIEAAEEKPKVPLIVDLDDVPYDKAIAKLWGNEKKPERVQLVEGIQLDIRLVCSSHIFRDTVPTLRPKWYAENHEYRGFYEAVKNDDLVPDIVSEGSRSNTLGNLQDDEKMKPTSLQNELPNKENKALRWKMRAWMWDTVHDHIWTEKRHIPIYTLALDTAQRMFSSLRPFVNHQRDESHLQALLWAITTKAGTLRALLTKEETVRYSLSLSKSMTPMDMHKVTGMKVLGVIGATHTDASQDIIRMVLFGPMVRYLMDEDGRCRLAQIETTAGVVKYRPEKEEELREM
ncbi:hypothetical protein EDB80DRAFT_879423 [Ilyonectria destructans]|nr:hypothetical protein EDB80DRAFT_879423 [Ilyonectria destructans]